MNAYTYRALDSKVLAVAVINKQVGDWTAYIGAVPGKNHDKEFQEVATKGSKLLLALAKLLFPEIAQHYYWRE